VRIDTSDAEAIPGVHAVLTAKDVPGAAQFGLVTRDQPVFASQVVRYQGEPIAAVAADHPEIAMRAARAIRVEYQQTEPLVDPTRAPTAPPIHPDGNVYRHLTVRRGDR